MNQSGELIVSGKDQVEIHLSGMPREVKCHFKDLQVCPAPCDIHHVDSLEYQVHHSIRHHSKYVLRINWSVSSVREIVWHIFY